MKAALFILLIIYLIVPPMLYKLNSQRVAKFCLFMTTSAKCRKFYCYILLLAVIYFHVVYYQIFRFEYFLMVSSILIIVMFKTRLTERFLEMLVEDNNKLMAFSATTLIIAFIPHMLSLAVSMAIILVGACFYPSEHIRQIDEYFLTGYYNECVRRGDFRDLEDAYFS